ncbi:hypothetical protein ACFVZD_45490 [Streptomyces sp. NPDC058287]|uniref:hypothetical protein n=1 Tax=unclassified Streptomyces TaxID=2593676 RepID=UPI0036EF128F
MLRRSRVNTMYAALPGGQDGRCADPAGLQRGQAIGYDTRHDVYRNRRAYVWDNRSDTAILRNDYGRFVDGASWRRHHYRR